MNDKLMAKNAKTGRYEPLENLNYEKRMKRILKVSES
jgi:hypothetical protein